MEKFDNIIEHLRKNELQNINVICFIENNQISDMKLIGNSVLVRGTSDRDWIYIKCSSLEDLKLIKAELTQRDENFGAIEDWMIPTLLEGRKLCWKLECEQYYLPKHIELPNPKYITTQLSLRDVTTVYDNSTYKDYISKDYIADRIERGISVGINENGRLVAWGMTQDDGGLGFLHVLDSYRRKGYGYSITISLIEAVRERGKIPFTYVEENNHQSKNLIKKLKFTFQKKIQWFQAKQ